MSHSKISKEIRNIQKFPINFSDNVILISDSKGRYIKGELSNSEQSFVKIIPISGTKCADPIIKRNVRRELLTNSISTVLLWFGTCELTTKTGRTVSLCETSEVVSRIIESYRSIRSEILSVSPSTKVLFIECPYYSIDKWNNLHANTKIGEFKQQDEELKILVDELNRGIHILNQERAPRLSQDLVISNKGKTRRNRNKIIYTNLPDGIHPNKILSKLWALRILKLVSV